LDARPSCRLNRFRQFALVIAAVPLQWLLKDVKGRQKFVATKGDGPSRAEKGSQVGQPLID
jgi:hypothetical protein